mmetsp:Transcript_22775/g.79574  ORF Transcript_22775/g.79574 Transcript_22775/m.79574 type:complete len:688 (-) Transcript_22775:75-2138(-)
MVRRAASGRSRPRWRASVASLAVAVVALASAAAATAPAVDTGWPRITRVAAGVGFDLEIAHASGGSGGAVAVVVLPSSAAAPSAAQIAAGTDAADAPAAATASDDTVPATGTVVVTVTGSLPAATSHTVYVLYPYHAHFAWELGGAGNRGAGAACVLDAHCDDGQGLVCDAAGLCAPAPFSGVRDAYLTSPSTPPTCADPVIAVADIAVAASADVAAPLSLVSFIADQASVRAIRRARQSESSPTLLLGRGPGSASEVIQVTLSAARDDGGSTTFPPQAVTVTCEHYSATPCAGDCGAHEATLELKLAGMTAAAFNDDAGAEGDALASELAAELGLHPTHAEFLGASDAADASGATLTFGYHLPAALSGSGGAPVQMSAAIDATPVASLSAARLPASLYNAAARLARRALGGCCMATVRPRLAAPAVGAGELAHDDRDVTLTVTVANAPDGGSDVTTVYYTTDGSTPTTSSLDSIAFAAGASSGSLVMPTAPAAGSTVLLRMLASTDVADVDDSIVGDAVLTWRDDVRAAPAVVDIVPCDGATVTESHSLGANTEFPRADNTDDLGKIFNNGDWVNGDFGTPQRLAAIGLYGSYKIAPRTCSYTISSSIDGSTYTVQATGDYDTGALTTDPAYPSDGYAGLYKLVVPNRFGAYARYWTIQFGPSAGNHCPRTTNAYWFLGSDECAEN